MQRTVELREEKAHVILSWVNPYMQILTESGFSVTSFHSRSTHAIFLKEFSIKKVTGTSLDSSAITHLVTSTGAQPDQCIHCIGEQATLAVLHSITLAQQMPSHWTLKSPLFICFLFTHVKDIKHIPIHFWPHLQLAHSIFFRRCRFTEIAACNLDHGVSIGFEDSPSFPPFSDAKLDVFFYTKDVHVSR